MFLKPHEMEWFTIIYVPSLNDDNKHSSIYVGIFEHKYKI